MYHIRLKNTHYDAGFHYGQMLKKHGQMICEKPTFQITKEKQLFVEKCIPIYQKYYPEILDEIKGIADGQQSSYEDLLIFLLSMYCFEVNLHCTCLACVDQQNILLGRNSDFLVSLEKLCMNCLYALDDCLSFCGNTTAFVEIEDGMNEKGLAMGMTFVYPSIKKPGFNAGFLVRYCLEKCQSVKECLKFIKTVPIASYQTLTFVDASGHIAVVECCPHHVEITEAFDSSFLVATNHFEKIPHHPHIDDWYSHQRYQNAYHALNQNKNISLSLIQDILSGKYGFMCQYDRKIGADTIWSVVYDVKNQNIYRVEGNPSRKKFKKDLRWR
ncbi:C45 family autoproteolytic acyltransferase/hydrolase [Allocoprobacillus halotolerans]|uniref:C45 family autoproteolytic acyltransferase/hydrolase n=1 Tax=Allocoprobacillus halotolerans TaxID=2944914 RepID=A0ABY5I6I4_9FIRM|nr:C45 family peptidase [Allocoprobacillus halotolerans]UTY40615.1 C45 family autoproteolytic acyltransferase/hydrolase [Allocoprobacillus halotolerans]